jgi:hypothetical protein
MAVCNALILVSLFTSGAHAKVDIDYSHNVAGNGTIITDYKMGDQETSVASGAIRGSGNVINSYSFSTNNSSDMRVEDRFVLTKTNEKETTMSVAPRLPPWPGKPGRFKLTGKNWAENIEIGLLGGPRNNNISHDLSLEASDSNKGKGKNAWGAEFKFSGASQEGTTASAATHISGTRNLNVDASLDIGRALDDKGFDYRTIWSNGGNVSVRSVIGEPRAVLYEDDGRTSGNSTGLKSLNIFSS